MQHWFWIGGQRVMREEMDSTKVAYVQGLLRFDYQQGIRPRCLCRNPGVDMVVRKLRSRYILAKMPDSGMKHHPDCESFNPWDSSLATEQAKSRLPIRDKNGIARLTLSLSLTDVPEILSDAPTRVVDKRPPTQRDSAQTTLLGLLHHAWSETGLNRWHPNMRGKRGWWTIHRLLTEYATSVTVSRLPLDELLFVPEPFNLDERQRQRDELHQHMRNFTVEESGARHSGLVIGELTGLIETPYGGRISMKHLKEFPIWLGKDAYLDITRRFSRAVQCIGEMNNPIRVVGIFVTHSGKDNQRFYAKNGALMTVSEQWIPVDSSYERQIADELVVNERHYLKPLRFDVEDDVVFPDFLLLDAHSKPVPMEIYGMSGSATYEQRKREKIAHYDRSGDMFWHWDVINSPWWPKLPQRIDKT